MVLVPWGRDQTGAGSRAAALGAATVVRREDCRPEALAMAIRRILEDPGFRETVARAASRRLQSTDSPSAAAVRVESSSWPDIASTFRIDGWRHTNTDRQLLDHLGLSAE